MKLLITITLLLLYQITFCQKIDESYLNQSLAKYENSEDAAEKDSLWNIVINHFEAMLELENFGGMQTQNRYNENQLGYEFVTIRQYDSENNAFTVHSILRGFEHWNYITEKKSDNTNQIIFKQAQTFDYYTEIHELGSKEFLLLTRFDEMSFSCQNAHVMKLSDNRFTQQDVLSVCSWTNVDESYPGPQDPETGLYTIEGGMKYYEPIPISFTHKNKIISYSFYRLKDGKEIIRKAKFKNGTFKIKSYDARTFDE